MPRLVIIERQNNDVGYEKEEVTDFHPSCERLDGDIQSVDGDPQKQRN
jgi:hypothetical protein